MNKKSIGILLSLAMMLGLASCGEKEVNTKLILNEVLIENQSNFQDDYGVHSAWIEVFNKSYTSADLAGFQLRMSNQPGDTATYSIPKGDVLTLVKPRQHALFWADGQPNRGTFHTNFVMDGNTATWVAPAVTSAAPSAWLFFVRYRGAWQTLRLPFRVTGKDIVGSFYEFFCDNACKLTHF